MQHSWCTYAQVASSNETWESSQDWPLLPCHTSRPGQLSPSAGRWPARDHSPRCRPATVEQFGHSDAAFCWETRQSGLMGQQIGDRYVRFPVGRELWPIARNWSIWVQQATLDQHMCTRCRHTLATRHEDADRVGGVRSIIHLIAPCPEIHHPFPVTIDAELRTTFILQLRFGKGVAYRLEAIFYNSIYFSHVNSSLSVSQDLFSLTPLQVQSFHSLPSGRKRS